MRRRVAIGQNFEMGNAVTIPKWGDRMRGRWLSGDPAEMSKLLNTNPFEEKSHGRIDNEA